MDVRRVADVGYFFFHATALATPSMPDGERLLLACFLGGHTEYRLLATKELDGGDPEKDDGRALISTAVRTCKTSGG